jgi:hypothetical protein
MPRFTSANTAEYSALSKGKPRKSAKSEALELQRIIMSKVRAAETKPADIAQLARAWEVLEERIRILKGKLLPSKDTTKTKRHNTPAVMTMPEVAPDVRSAVG